MSLVLHIMRKDARALRLAWLFWLLLMAAEVALVAMEFHARVPRAGEYAHSDVGLDVVALLWAIGVYLLAAGVILQDSPVGTKAFWPTRPISGAALLSAKVLWILAFLVLAPALIWVPWEVYCSYGAEGIALSVLHDCLIPLLLTGTAVVIAALAGDGPRFMLYNVLLAAFVAASGATLAASGKGFVQGDVPLLLLSVFGIAAVIVQFLMRRRSLSVGLGASGLGLSLLSVFLWPNAKLFDKHPSVTGSPSAELITAEMASHPQLVRVQDGRAYGLNFFINVKGAPIDVALDTGRADVSLEWPDGSRQDFHGVRLNENGWANSKARSVETALKLPKALPAYGDPETLAKDRGLWKAGQERMLKRDPNWKVVPFSGDWPVMAETPIGYAAWINLTPEIARRITASPPKCTVSMDVFMVRPSIVVTLPLDSPNGQSANGARVHVLLSEESYVPSAKHSFLDTSIVYDSAPNRPLQGFEYDSRGGSPRDIWASGLISGAGSSSFPRPNLGFISLHLPVSQLWRTDHWVDDPSWRPSARLAAVTFESAGSFSKVVQSDRLVAKESWGQDP